MFFLLQDPTNLDKFNVSNFFHVKNNMKIIDPGTTTRAGLGTGGLGGTGLCPWAKPPPSRRPERPGVLLMPEQDLHFLADVQRLRLVGPRGLHLPTGA